MSVPSDQTIEGGVQIRVTRSGFENLKNVARAVINDTFADGICIGRIEQSLVVADVEACHKNNCSGGARGCNVNLNIESMNMGAVDSDTFHIDITFNADTVVAARLIDPLFGATLGSCDMTIDVNSGYVGVDLDLFIDQASGELDFRVGNIDLNLSGFDAGNCGIIDDILDFVIDILSSAIGDFIIDLLAPVIEDLVRGFLPDPLGLAGIIDVGSFIGGISPGTSALLETELIPGGYVSLPQEGLSLGMITGFNADEDIATRSADLDSEPAYCVPPFAPPDFAAAPHFLVPHPSRGNFQLQAAGAFLGMPSDPATDLIIGVSETFLDLTGHHIVSSGAMCLGVGTDLVPQLNLGLVGLLVPSLAELGSERGDDPLLLVVRPTTGLDFTIGDGTAESPSITVHIRNLQIDFYGFLFERFVRGFTIELDMDVGVNLEFTLDDMGNPALEPVILGLETDQIGLTVHNSEFLREDPGTLEQVLPSVFDLALPLITEGLGVITLPDFAGFTLTDIEITKVTTAEDDFLALYASLVATMSMTSRFSVIVPGEHLNELLQPEPTSVPVETEIRLVSVHTPPPAVIRDWMARRGGALPTAVIEVDSRDELGRELEWTYRVNGGFWHPYTQERRLEIAERVFGLQGAHTVEVKARAVGDFRSIDMTPARVELVVDSAGPRMLRSQFALDNGRIATPAHDLVLPDETIEYAFGRPSEDEPATGWSREPGIDVATAKTLAEQGLVVVYARDEFRNTTVDVVDVGTIIGFHGRGGGDGGCECSSAGGAPGLGGAILAGLVLLGLGFAGGLRRKLARVHRWLPIAALVVGSAVNPACNCSSNPASMPDCELDEDCADSCPAGTLPICFDNACLCADDIDPGRIGAHSEVAVASGGAAWVSAYNETHGDLMIARWPESGRIPDLTWEYVDGVPDGPVALPQSDIRGGILAPGDDVGLYTDIAVSATDVVMVSYFDKTNASLKFVSNVNGAWQPHEVDGGSIGGDPELGYEIAGQYTSITVRSDDGRPGIAYFAQIAEGTEVLRTELRFASAKTNAPQSAADWDFFVVDSAAVPISSDGDPFVIPEGVGLFVKSTRAADDSPVMVYYDRINGDLKLATFDGVSGQFTTSVVDAGDDPNNPGGTVSDVGWYPSVAVDADGTIHIAYVDATFDDLKYYSTLTSTRELVDDGYRIDGTSEDGLPLPVFHFVGDDSEVVLTSNGPVIVYQDATTHELLVAQRNASGLWQRITIAGNEDPFQGGYGFYASGAFDGDSVVMSTWVIDQPAFEVWVEIFRHTVVVE